MNILILDNKEEAVKTAEILNRFTSCTVLYATGVKEAKTLFRKEHIDVLISETHTEEDGNIMPFLSDTKKKLNRLNILILSDSDAYKAEALDMKVSGYLKKTCNQAALKKEMEDLRYPLKQSGVRLRVQCFGNFTVFTPTGKPVHFSRSKEKELLAYLIYKHGSSVSTRELGAILFEDQEYDSRQQTYLQQIFHALTIDLRKIAAEDVLIRDYNSTSIDISKVDCDYYRFSNNEAIAKRLYTGEFMVQYEWADYVAAYLDRKA